MIYFGLIFLLFVAIYVIFSTRQQLKIIQLKTQVLYHDINSSLVIVKLTQDSLKDISTELKNSGLTSLIDSLNDGITNIEGSFRSWNV